jgi:hypothetical protein
MSRVETGPQPDQKSNIQQFFPKEHEVYFKDMHNKHFDPEKAVGSLFTEAKNIEELLEKVIEQRGSLDGDDRQKFIEMGIKSEALMPQCRYLKVDTKGEFGIIKATDLSPDTKVKIIRTKAGAPCSLVVLKKELPQVDYGTVVIGPNEGPEPSTKEMIWTVHPGLPVRPASKDIWPEGSEITIKDVINELGEDAYLNVKKE